MTGSASHKGMKVRWDDVMMRQRYHPLIAYKQSKLCDILFAKALNDRYDKIGVRAYVVDPGLVQTAIGNKETGSLVNFVWSLRKRFGVSPEVPARTFAYLCETDGALQGLYYSDCQERSYSREVTCTNADRLFLLSERLCGVCFGKGRPS